MFEVSSGQLVATAVVAKLTKEWAAVAVPDGRRAEQDAVFGAAETLVID